MPSVCFNPKFYDWYFSVMPEDINMKYCGDVHLILHHRIDDLSNFLKYSRTGVRVEQEKAGKRGEPSVLISFHCPVTPTVTFML